MDDREEQEPTVSRGHRKGDGLNVAARIARNVKCEDGRVVPADTG